MDDKETKETKITGYFRKMLKVDDTKSGKIVFLSKELEKDFDDKPQEEQSALIHSMESSMESCRIDLSITTLCDAINELSKRIDILEAKADKTQDIQDQQT